MQKIKEATPKILGEKSSFGPNNFARNGQILAEKSCKIMEESANFSNNPRKRTAPLFHSPSGPNSGRSKLFHHDFSANSTVDLLEALSELENFREILDNQLIPSLSAVQQASLHNRLIINQQWRVLPADLFFSIAEFIRLPDLLNSVVIVNREWNQFIVNDQAHAAAAPTSPASAPNSALSNQPAENNYFPSIDLTSNLINRPFVGEFETISFEELEEKAKQRRLPAIHNSRLSVRNNPINNLINSLHSNSTSPGIKPNNLYNLRLFNRSPLLITHKFLTRETLSSDSSAPTKSSNSVILPHIPAVLRLHTRRLLLEEMTANDFNALRALCYQFPELSEIIYRSARAVGANKYVLFLLKKLYSTQLISLHFYADERASWPNQAIKILGHLPLLQQFTVSFANNSSKASFQRHLGNNQPVDLNELRYLPSSLQLLALQNVQHLPVNQHNFHENTLQSFNQLRFIDFESSQPLLNDRIMEIIANNNAASLQFLSLSNKPWSKATGITPTGLAACLSQLKRLVELDLSYNPVVDDAVLAAIGQLKHLQLLNLHSSAAPSNNSTISDSNTANIIENSITSLGLQHLFHCNQLTKLNLSYIGAVDGEFINSALFVGQFSRLQHINLTSCTTLLNATITPLINFQEKWLKKWGAQYLEGNRPALQFYLDSPAINKLNAYNRGQSNRKIKQQIHYKVFDTASTIFGLNAAEFNQYNHTNFINPANNAQPPSNANQANPKFTAHFATIYNYI
jgi:hypothetical protein